MTKNPYLNAFIAALYIVGVVHFIQYVLAPGDGPETILIPIAMLSLLVLSAAFMGFLFFYEPLQKFLDGDRAGGVRFFLQTLGTFAAITITLLSVLAFSIVPV